MGVTSQSDSEAKTSDSSTSEDLEQPSVSNLGSLGFKEVPQEVTQLDVPGNSTWISNRLFSNKMRNRFFSIGILSLFVAFIEAGLYAFGYGGGWILPLTVASMATCVALPLAVFGFVFKWYELSQLSKEVEHAEQEFREQCALHIKQEEENIAVLNAAWQLVLQQEDDNQKAVYAHMLMMGISHIRQRLSFYALTSTSEYRPTDESADLDELKADVYQKLFLPSVSNSGEDDEGLFRKIETLERELKRYGAESEHIVRSTSDSSNTESLPLRGWRIVLTLAYALGTLATCVYFAAQVAATAAVVAAMLAPPVLPFTVGVGVFLAIGMTYGYIKLGDKATTMQNTVARLRGYANAVGAKQRYASQHVAQNKKLLGKVKLATEKNKALSKYQTVNKDNPSAQPEDKPTAETPKLSEFSLLGRRPRSLSADDGPRTSKAPIVRTR